MLHFLSSLSSLCPLFPRSIDGTADISVIIYLSMMPSLKVRNKNGIFVVVLAMVRCLSRPSRHPIFTSHISRMHCRPRGLASLTLGLYNFCTPAWSRSDQSCRSCRHTTSFYRCVGQVACDKKTLLPDWWDILSNERQEQSRRHLHVIADVRIFVSSQQQEQEIS